MPLPAPYVTLDTILKGGHLRIYVEFTNENGVLVDPVSLPSVTVYDKAEVIVDASTSMVKLAVGKYEHYVATAAKSKDKYFWEMLATFAGTIIVAQRGVIFVQ